MFRQIRVHDEQPLVCFRAIGTWTFQIAWQGAHRSIDKGVVVKGVMEVVVFPMIISIVSLPFGALPSTDA